jgi:hypothetical protein
LISISFILAPVSFLFHIISICLHLSLENKKDIFLIATVIHCYKTVFFFAHAADE